MPKFSRLESGQFVDLNYVKIFFNKLEITKMNYNIVKQHGMIPNDFKGIDSSANNQCDIYV